MKIINALLLVLIAIFCAFVMCNAGGTRHKIAVKVRDEKVGPGHGDDDNHDGRKDGHLRQNFYKESCPRAEEIVKTITTKHVAADQSVAAKLLRLHYHDCFVRGCDGSILLDSTPDSKSEKEARPNLTLEGYEIIDEIKKDLENECNQTVSCADILTLAARDAVSHRFGKPMWKVPTGRRDGTITNTSEALLGLPSPFSNFTTLMVLFQDMKLDLHDLVTLSGAHTIGKAHCGGFRKRLFNFTGVGDQDPSIDPTYADTLKDICEDPLDRTTLVEMDPQSFESFDNNYYINLKDNKGLFQSDAALLTNDKAKEFAHELLNLQSFFDQFAKSVQKMGAIQVLTGTEGEIRKNCRVVNK